MSSSAISNVSTAPAHPRPTNLSFFLKSGYNAKSGNFLNSPIFDLTYNQSTTTIYNGLTCSVPDQVDSFDPTTESLITSVQTLLEDEYQLKQAYGVKVNGHYEGLTYSASVSSEYAATSGLFTSSSNQYSLNFYIQKAYAFRRDRATTIASLTAAFQADLNVLPNTISSKSDYQEFSAFFDKYGTYFIQQGNMGGYLTIESTISDQIVNTDSSISIKGSIDTAFSSIIGSGDISVSAMYDSSTFLKKHKNYVSLQIYAVGGQYSEYPETFLANCLQNPTIILTAGSESMSPEMLPLSALVSGNDTLAATMEQAINAYLNVNHIGFPQTVQLSTQIQNNYDALLVSYMHYGSGGRGYMTASCASQAGALSFEAYSSAHNNLPTDRWIWRSSLAFPVRQGDTGVVDLVVTCAPNPTVQMNQFSIGRPDDDGQVFGSSTNILTMNSCTGSDTNAYTAPSDGLVVMTAQYAVAGGRGYLTAEINGALRGACAAHEWVPTDVHFRQNSATFPVKNGDLVTFAWTTTAQSMNYVAQFIPLTSLLQLDSCVDEQFGISTQAATDGFLVAVLDASVSDGSRGYVEMRLSSSLSELSNADVISGNSVHNWMETDNWIWYATAFLPVPRGAWYCADNIPTVAGYNAFLYWIPLVNPTQPNYS